MPVLIEWRSVPPEEAQYLAGQRGGLGGYYKGTGDPAITIDAESAQDITVIVAFWKPIGSGFRDFTWSDIKHKAETLEEAKAIAERDVKENYDVTYSPEVRR